MALDPGTRLSSYEILGPLGAGGMGEVYRARDTKLQREVAIKVLPPDMVGDEDRLRRFEREARTLAQLNHANIAGIHGVDQVGDVCLLALELVPGEDLAARLAHGALPVDEALDVCRQIAEGLEAAHEAGVVHRDLKPANVRVTPEGDVKILDFGLAKPMGPRRGGEGTTTAQEDSFLMTEEGVVLGTPTYMSPEQARGKPVDRRTDVWAFGCVLYECLTGRRAFRGGSLTDVLAAIVDREPDFDIIPKETPRAVVQLLRRCLHKTPRQRLRDIGEARVLLEDPHAHDEDTSVQVGNRRGALPKNVAIVALAIVAAALLAERFATEATPSPDTSTRFRLEETVTDRGEWGGDLVALSRDGRTLAFVGVPGDSRVHVRPLDAFDPRPLAGTEGAHSPFFSPDGSRIGYWTDGRLMAVPTEGGTPDVLADTTRLNGASWGTDHRIAAIELGKLITIDVRTGETALLVDDVTEFNAAPSFLPDGKTVLFDRGFQLHHIDVDGGAFQPLDHYGTAPRWSATGHIVARADDGSLWALPFDPDRLQSLGPAVQIVDLPVVDHDVADDGTLVYVPSLGSHLELVWVDRTGEPTALELGLEEYMVPRLSPDDRHAAVSIRDGSGFRIDLWVFDLSRGSRTRITTDGAWNLWAVWIEQATQLAFMGDGYLWAIASDGSGERRQLSATGNRHEVPMSWSEDAQSLAFYDFDQGGNLKVLRDDGTVEEFLVTRFDERAPHFSPDGRWIAYVSDQSGVNEVYVRPYARGQAAGSRVAISSGGGGEPRWSRDGRELFYRKGTQMFAATFEPGSPPVVGVSSLLFDRPYQQSAIGRSNPNYDVAADGRFLMMRVPDDAQGGTPRVHVVRGLLP